MQQIKKQALTVNNREELLVNGITKVLGFDSDYVLLESESGRITVEGESLAIENLTKECGDLQISGKITAVIFSDAKKSRGGLFSGLFK